MEARMAIIAITTSNSTKVKDFLCMGRFPFSNVLDFNYDIVPGYFHSGRIRNFTASALTHDTSTIYGLGMLLHHLLSFGQRIQFTGFIPDSARIAQPLRIKEEIFGH